ncbi:MAG TPA: hypothetical protein HA252_06725 [Candidatus Diapherotrites archaeon]|uniref:KaiC domain-containing protein n=1 Tax=Candidatus Iainarchaeum sp. TaxID=3101447 RepID=A0A7J4JH53_9ARCH|nr:hypothetical protein [Candidatus Diapherotrites archaeon]HIH17072.1 hypothetical protein [Candidatus Diapherotrites archaeon]
MAELPIFCRSRDLHGETRCIGRRRGRQHFHGHPRIGTFLGGGFPKGAVVLVAGSSGSGKTIFSFNWLFDGARKGENGVYVTFTEPLFKSVKNLEVMDFYDRKLIEDETIKILDIRDLYAEQGFDAQRILDTVERQVKETNAKRLCIDSVTAIAYNLDDKAKTRKFIFVDSLSTMLIYNRPDVFARFIHSVLVKIRLNSISGLLLFIETQADREVRAEIAQLCDKVLRV